MLISFSKDKDSRGSILFDFRSKSFVLEEVGSDNDLLKQGCIREHVKKIVLLAGQSPKRGGGLTPGS